jgi:hypothetical protein
MPSLHISLVVSAGPRRASARTTQKAPLPNVREVESKRADKVKIRAKVSYTLLLGRKKTIVLLDGSQAPPTHPSALLLLTDVMRSECTENTVIFCVCNHCYSDDLFAVP